VINLRQDILKHSEHITKSYMSGHAKLAENVVKKKKSGGNNVEIIELRVGVEVRVGVGDLAAVKVEFLIPQGCQQMAMMRHHSELFQSHSLSSSIGYDGKKAWNGSGSRKRILRPKRTT